MELKLVVEIRLTPEQQAAIEMGLAALVRSTRKKRRTPKRG